VTATVTDVSENLSLHLYLKTEKLKPHNLHNKTKYFHEIQSDAWGKFHKVPVESLQLITHTSGYSVYAIS